MTGRVLPVSRGLRASMLRTVCRPLKVSNGLCNCRRAGSPVKVEVRCPACEETYRGHYCKECLAAVRAQEFCTGSYRADGLLEETGEEN